MSLYDYVGLSLKWVTEYNLEAGSGFQTKDLGCGMNHYFVDETGRLIEYVVFQQGNTRQMNSTDTNLNGQIEIYTDRITPDDDFLYYHYIVTFNDGQLQDIKALE